MNKKSLIKTTLILGFFLIALGGWLVHAKIHPPQEKAVNLIPFIVGTVSTFILPILFCFRKTIAIAYIFCGFTVIIGSITMTHFSIVHLQLPLTFISLLVATMLPDIAILWGKFALGKAIFDLETLKSDTTTTSSGYFFRYPNMGWWWVHLVGLAIIYTIGHLLWK